MKRKVFKFTFYGVSAGLVYYYGNSLFSEYHEIKQIKKKFLSIYPELTQIILLSNDEEID